MATETPQLHTQLVVFSLGREEYALPIAHVQEIIRYEKPRRVTSTTPWLQGVISLRGKIVPVCDLASRLGGSSEQPEQAKIVIVETRSGPAGLIVDEVEEVRTIEGEQLETVPGSSSELVQAIAKVDERMIVLLDSEGLFSGLDLAES